MLKVSKHCERVLNRYRSNLDQLERKFSNKIVTFIDPYKQNDNYTIEIKKNAYFDYEYNWMIFKSFSKSNYIQRKRYQKIEKSIS